MSAAFTARAVLLGGEELEVETTVGDVIGYDDACRKNSWDRADKMDPVREECWITWRALTRTGRTVAPFAEFLGQVRYTETKRWRPADPTPPEVTAD
jgi:hypothetical protein